MGYLDVVSEDRPSGLWPMQVPSGTTERDASGGPSTHDASYTGGVTLAQPGPLVGASSSSVLYNGSTGYLNPGSIAATLSMESWFQPNTAVSAGTFYGCVMSSAQANGREQVWLGQGSSSAPNCLVTVTQNTGAGVDFAGYQLVGGSIDATWHHLGLCWASGWQIFLDGVERDNLTFGSQFNWTSTNVYFGGGPQGGNWFAGRMAWGAVYPQVISPDRWLAHYRTGKNQGFGQGVWTPDRRRRLTV